MGQRGEERRLVRSPTRRYRCFGCDQNHERNAGGMVIRVAAISVEGESDIGPFSGTMLFTPGLQVISAQNAYGKSLAAKAFAWCLGLEAMFGVADNDAGFFPLAVREEVELTGHPAARVLASRCSVTI